MHTPAISVLLPFHNAAAFIRQAIGSVLAQSCRDWELVLVNNASSDDSLTIAQSFTDPRIRMVHEPVKGIAFALNTGLAHCRGRYIARMDADDVMLPGRLAMQSQFLDEEPSFDLVSGLVEFSSDLDDARGYEAYVQQVNAWRTEDEIRQHRFVESPFAHPSVMFREELVEKFGAYDTSGFPEDYELWLRWLDKGVRMHKLAVPVLKWNDHLSRLSRVHPHYSPEAFDRVRYHYLAKWLKPRVSSLPPLYAWGGGKLARKKMKLLESEGIAVKGLVDVTNISTQLPFIHYKNIPAPGEIFIVSLVSNRGRYADIRDFLIDRGYKAEQDFILAG